LERVKEFEMKPKNQTINNDISIIKIETVKKEVSKKDTEKKITSI
jgi:hypothetical protein